LCGEEYIVNSETQLKTKGVKENNNSVNTEIIETKTVSTMNNLNEYIEYLSENKITSEVQDVIKQIFDKCGSLSWNDKEVIFDFNETFARAKFDDNDHAFLIIKPRQKHVIIEVLCESGNANNGGWKNWKDGVYGAYKVNVHDIAEYNSLESHLFSGIKGIIKPSVSSDNNALSEKLPADQFGKIDLFRKQLESLVMYFNSKGLTGYEISESNSRVSVKVGSNNIIMLFPKGKSDGRLSLRITEGSSPKISSLKLIDPRDERYIDYLFNCAEFFQEDVLKDIERVYNAFI
jgi:hypothetical protein